MNDTLAYLRSRQEKGGYNALHQLRVVDAREGYAEILLPAGEQILNPLGGVHGGAIYTLCDVAAGTAAASRGRVGVTLSANINYLRPGHADEPLTAVTKEIRHGKQTAVYEVEVRQGGRLLATAVFTMYYIERAVESLPG